MMTLTGGREREKKESEREREGGRGRVRGREQSTCFDIDGRLQFPSVRHLLTRTARVPI